MNESPQSDKASGNVEMLLQLSTDLEGLNDEIAARLSDNRTVQVATGLRDAWRDAAAVLHKQSAYEGDPVEMPEGYSVSGNLKILFAKIRGLVASDEEAALLDELEQRNVEALDRFENILEEPLLEHADGILGVHYNKLQHLLTSLKQTIDAD